VKQPFINVEERIDRFVGRRTRTPDALALAGASLIQLAAQIPQVLACRLARL
jgi:hypothetical protein